MAIGAMRAIRACGCTVPGDISVVGFDDVAIAAYTDPPLTTIAQAIAELGRWAVERLVERLAEAGAGVDGHGPAGRAAGGHASAGTVLPVRLIARGSSGPPREAGTRPG
jgi:DNA-binding LacI/PurR family transcriptional regulator